VTDDSPGIFAAAWAQADLRRVVGIIDPDVEAQLTELLATLAGTDQRNVA
jgi:hypothetical protein